MTDEIQHHLRNRGHDFVSIKKKKSARRSGPSCWPPLTIVPPRICVPDHNPPKPPDK